MCTGPSSVPRTSQNSSRQPPTGAKGARRRRVARRWPGAAQLLTGRSRRTKFSGGCMVARMRAHMRPCARACMRACVCGRARARAHMHVHAACTHARCAHALMRARADARMPARAHACTRTCIQRRPLRRALAAKIARAAPRPNG